MVATTPKRSMVESATSIALLDPNPSSPDQPSSSKWMNVALVPNPLSLASFDRVAAYSAATIGYDGGNFHFARYSSGVISVWSVAICRLSILKPWPQSRQRM